MATEHITVLDVLPGDQIRFAREPVTYRVLDVHPTDTYNVVELELSSEDHGPERKIVPTRRVVEVDL